MKKGVVFILCFILLSGCAPYRIQQGAEKPYTQGFIATREGKVIPEYTIGKDGKPPADKQLAQERFIRRRRIVEDYYKKMGIIENRLKENVWDRFIFFWSMVGGVFNMPVRFAAEYRYLHNPEYKARVDKIMADKEAALKERIEALRKELGRYIEEDLRKEEEASALRQLQSESSESAKENPEKICYTDSHGLHTDYTQINTGLLSVHIRMQSVHIRA